MTVVEKLYKIATEFKSNMSNREFTVKMEGPDLITFIISSYEHKCKGLKPINDYLFQSLQSTVDKVVDTYNEQYLDEISLKSVHETTENLPVSFSYGNAVSGAYMADAQQSVRACIAKSIITYEVEYNDKEVNPVTHMNEQTFYEFDEDDDDDLLLGGDGVYESSLDDQFSDMNMMRDPMADYGFDDLYNEDEEEEWEEDTIDPWSDDELEDDFSLDIDEDGFELEVEPVVNYLDLLDDDDDGEDADELTGGFGEEWE
jgi:hypothetical protein